MRLLASAKEPIAENTCGLKDQPVELIDGPQREQLVARREILSENHRYKSNAFQVYVAP